MYAFVNEYCMLGINVSSVTRVYFLICVLSYTLPVTNAAAGKESPLKPNFQNGFAYLGLPNWPDFQISGFSNFRNLSVFEFPDLSVSVLTRFPNFLK